MISPLFLVPKAHHVVMEMLLFTNRTLPSHIVTFKPPGWLLVALWYPENTAPQADPQSIRQSAH